MKQETALHCELELSEPQKVLGIFCLFVFCILLPSQPHEKTGSLCFWEKDARHDTGIMHTCQHPSPMHASGNVYSIQETEGSSFCAVTP